MVVERRARAVVLKRTGGCSFACREKIQRWCPLSILRNVIRRSWATCGGCLECGVVVAERVDVLEVEVYVVGVLNEIWSVVWCGWLVVWDAGAVWCRESHLIPIQHTTHQ